MRALPSVDGFEVQRVSGLYGSDADAPYDYVEIIDINSPPQFAKDVATDTMDKVAAEFQGFADNPTFMLTENMESNQ